MSQEDITATVLNVPDMSKFSDVLIGLGYRKHSLGASLRDRLLYPSDTNKTWTNTPLQYIWCDMSIWETIYGSRKLYADLEEAKTTGRPFRTTSLLRMRGVNHFVRSIKSYILKCIYAHTFIVGPLGTARVSFEDFNF
jgi:hypothetical protein